MATYYDPGVYIQQVLVPGALNIASVPFTVGIVGPGSRSKRVSNEVVLRGLVEDETLTVAGTSPHTATLANRALRTKATTTVYRNGTALPDSRFSFNAATITGLTAASVNLGAGNAFAFEMDGHTPATINFLESIPVATGGFVHPDQVPLAGPVVGTSFTGPFHMPSTTSAAAAPAYTIQAVTDGAWAGGNVTVTGVDAAGVVVTAVWLQASMVGAGTYDPDTLPATPMVEITGIAAAGGAGSAVEIYFACSGPMPVCAEGTHIYVGSTYVWAAALHPLLAAAFNGALADASSDSLGYTAAAGYGTCMTTSVATTALVLTSPASAAPATPNLNVSDVRVFAAFANNASVAIWHGSGSLDARTIITVDPLSYVAGSAYTADYVATSDADDLIDEVSYSTITQVASIGFNAGGSDLQLGTDYQVTSPNSVDFTVDEAAVVVGLPAAAPASGAIKVSLDGRPKVEVTLGGLVNPPPGYVAAPATLANLATNINAVLGASVYYGPRYDGVAVATTVITLTSPTAGAESNIAFYEPTGTDETDTLFGISSYPTSVPGTGRKPTLGSEYFVSYDTPRPDTDYNVQKRFFTLDAAAVAIGPMSDDNPLMIATELAFLNGAPYVVTVQVDDASDPGSPVEAEWLDGLAAFETSDTATEIIALTTDLVVQLDLKNHIEAEASLVNKHYRRAWYGMPNNTSPGDRDTPNTFVYLATQSLEGGITPTSPARGRMVVVAPPQLAGVTRYIRLADTGAYALVDFGASQNNMGSTCLAVAVAAKLTSFASPADTLVRKTITGFNISDQTAWWSKGERAVMAQDGVTVVTFDAGNFILLDPKTTEAGGGGLVSFTQISASTQRDNITRKVDRALDASIVGLVPLDLADFIVDIRSIIVNVLNGEVGKGIGFYKNDDGSTRELSPTRDVQVEQDPDNPTKFYFRYWFNIRYPALYLFGEYSVDAPFFS